MGKFLSTVAQVGSSLFTKMTALCMLAMLCVLGNTAFAEGVTLPDTGVDVPAILTALITALGALLGTVLLAKLAFVIVRKGYRWVRGVG